MKLEAFALLLTCPVHEEAVDQMHLSDRHHHHTGDAERRYSPKQAQDQADPAEELRDDGQKCEDRWNARALQAVQGPGEAVASPPTQYFLGSVREKHRSQRQAQDGWSGVGVRVNQFA